MRNACYFAFLLILGHSDTYNSELQYSREKIQGQLEAQWRSISTLSLRCEESPCDTSGEPIPGKTRITFEYCIGKDNERKFAVSQTKHNGETQIIEEFKEDGQFKYVAMRNPETSAITSVSISRQQSNRDQYNGPRFAALWLLLPAGRPVSSLLKEGAKATQKDGIIQIAAENQELNLVVSISPEHDWLPIKVESSSPSGTVQYEVTEFHRVNGRYYPKAGITNSKHGKRIFKMSEFHINTTFPDDFFSINSFPKGITVYDNVKNQNYSLGLPRKRRISGGVNQNKRTTPSKDNATKNKLIIADTNPSVYYWVLSAASMALLVASGLMTWYRQRSK